MDTETEPSNPPTQIESAVGSFSEAMAPGVIKALSRLLGAAIDVPVAWLEQKKAKIDTQTESYKLVEASIAAAAASGAGSDPETAQRAIEVLVRKEYRKQDNRKAVATAMIEDMRDHVSDASVSYSSLPKAELDEDWLNVFERYAEDASSDRLQGLWGRVLAGEVRKPGRFSTRTLRFLSEFSQADALTFEDFAKCAFGEAAPKKLVAPLERLDIRTLINLESNGLIQGASGIGLERRFNFNEDGHAMWLEGELCIVYWGEPNSTVRQKIIALTPLGQELLSLVTSRNPRECAKAVALASRVPEIHECRLGELVHSHEDRKIQFIEILWLKESSHEPIVQGTASVIDS